MFKVGVLYRIQDFLNFVRNNQLTSDEFHQSFPTFDLILSDQIIKIAKECGWVSINPKGLVCLTQQGQDIFNIPDPKLKLREQLRKIIELTSPSWLGLAQRGRKAVLRFANLNTIQCLKDAGLLDDDDPQVAHWWDEITRRTWAANDAGLVEIGRQGEWLSMQFEEGRVGKKPIWTALDNNSAGYDILSIVDGKNTDNLIIEVKASKESFKKAKFFLTRNEWEVLSSHRNAILHLWSNIYTKPLLTKMTTATLAHHIPRDKNTGLWQVGIIPFTAR